MDSAHHQIVPEGAQFSKHKLHTSVALGGKAGAAGLVGKSKMWPNPVSVAR